MRRSVLVLSVAVVLAFAGVRGAATQALTVDDIIAKNLQAKGGADKMRAVQSIKQTSHLTAQGGIEAQMTIYSKRPNMTRQEMTITAMGQTMVMAFDGETAWTINPLAGMSSPTALNGAAADQMKLQADFDGPLVDYKSKGYTIAFIGTEPVGEKKAYHLKLTGKDQTVQDCYIDTDSNLESKIVSEATTPMGKQTIEQQLADYRDVQGMKVPFLIRTVSNGTEIAKIQVEKVEINTKIDDALFKLPKG